MLDGHLRLIRGPRENGFRPSIDVMFRSAAESCGRRTIGVVLSGTLADRTAGLRAIRESGGTTIVQHPSDALYTGMPKSAIRNVSPDHVVPLSGLAPLLNRLITAPMPPASGASGLPDVSVRPDPGSIRPS